MLIRGGGGGIVRTLSTRSRVHAHNEIFSFLKVQIFMERRAKDTGKNRQLHSRRLANHVGKMTPNIRYRI